MVRRDSLGRRIGRNPWREYVMDAYGPARAAWELEREATCIGYATEERGYGPGPTLKAYLLQLKGTWAQ